MIKDIENVKIHNFNSFLPYILIYFLSAKCLSGNDGLLRLKNTKEVIINHKGWLRRLARITNDEKEKCRLDRYKMYKPWRSCFQFKI